MFLDKKQLIAKNKKRAKNHIELIKNELLNEVERIVNKEELSLEHQDSENLEIFGAAMRNVLLKTLKIWNGESI